MIYFILFLSANHRIQAHPIRQFRSEDTSRQRQRHEHTPIRHQHHRRSEQIRRVEASERRKLSRQGSKKEKPQEHQVGNSSLSRSLHTSFRAITSPPSVRSRFKKKKHGKKEEKREERNKLEKRLSTMTEEEEDEGITIKVTDTTLHL